MLFAQQGLVNGVIQAVGFAPQPFFSNSGQAMWILIATTVWRNLGYYMVVYLAALQGVPQDLYEAASVDGATRILGPGFGHLPRRFAGCGLDDLCGRAAERCDPLAVDHEELGHRHPPMT